MYDTSRVSRCDPFRDLGSEDGHIIGGHRAVADRNPQRLALDELRNDEERSAPTANIVDTYDVRMVQRAGGSRLSFKLCLACTILGDFRRQDLQRDIAA